MSIEDTAVVGCDCNVGFTFVDIRLTDGSVIWRRDGLGGSGGRLPFVSVPPRCSPLGVTTEADSHPLPGPVSSLCFEALVSVSGVIETTVPFSVVARADGVVSIGACTRSWRNVLKRSDELPMGFQSRDYFNQAHVIDCMGMFLVAAVLQGYCILPNMTALRYIIKEATRSNEANRQNRI